MSQFPIVLKYVRHSEAGFVVWPKNYDEVHHAHIGRLLERNVNLAPGRLLSAGFVEFGADGLPKCYGKSESLGMSSLPEDTDALRAGWGLPA